MKKIIKVLVIVCLFFLSTNVLAVEMNFGEYQIFDAYDQVGTGQVQCSSLGSFANTLNEIFDLFKIVAPILVIVMSVYDFIKALSTKIDGEIKTAFMRLVKRLIFAAILFFLPILLNFFLGLIDPTYTTCINA